MSSSKADLNNSCDQLVFLCYTNNQKKKTNDPNTSGSQFDDNKSDLQEKNHVSGKITMLSGGYWTLMQLSVFKIFVFTWKLNWKSVHRFYSMIDDITRDIQLMGKKYLSNGCCLMSFQQKPYNGMPSQMIVLQTQRLIYNLLCELTFMFSFLSPQGIFL